MRFVVFVNLENGQIPMISNYKTLQQVHLKPPTRRRRPNNNKH
jgi:hypothetical protein